MGYNLSTGGSASCFNSPDASTPRSAIMGGAVVAALTSFQDEVVVQAFDNSGMFTELGNLQEESVYLPAKSALIKELHTHFLYKEATTLGGRRLAGQREVPSSPFSKGDTDIFLQASPLTQAVMDVFHTHDIGPDLLEMIGSYVGNSGRNSLCQGDLERYLNKAMEPEGAIKAPEETKFAFAVSRNAVSFILGKQTYNSWDKGTYDDVTWPRTSQFIMLDCQADLLGGLLDFDQSIVACSYDGVSVRAAPRAVLSLMTNANFVTPFCFEEHRNKQRFIKYCQRGFKPYLVDPNNSRPSQNVGCDNRVRKK